MSKRQVQGMGCMEVEALTHRAVQVDIAQAAGEEEAKLHRGLVSVPDAHAVVGHHRAHGVVARVVPLLLAQLEHLLQLLAQVPVCLCQQCQLSELAHCSAACILLSKRCLW